MRYEAVVLSGGEETDYSSGEETPSHPPPPPPPPPPPEVSPSLSCHTSSFTVDSSFTLLWKKTESGVKRFVHHTVNLCVCVRVCVCVCR